MWVEYVDIGSKLETLDVNISKSLNPLPNYLIKYDYLSHHYAEYESDRYKGFGRLAPNQDRYIGTLSFIRSHFTCIIGVKSKQMRL